MLEMSQSALLFSGMPEIRLGEASGYVCQYLEAVVARTLSPNITLRNSVNYELTHPLSYPISNYNVYQGLSVNCL